MSPVSPTSAAVVLAAALIAAVTDVWKFKVYNALTLPLLVSGLLVRAGGGWAELSDGLLGALFGFGVLIVFYVLGGMGAGDVKFLAGLGAWLGMPATYHVFVAGTLMAGGYALALVLLRGRPRETWARLQVVWHHLLTLSRHLSGDDRVEAEADRPGRRHRLVPYAAMTALGLAATLAWGWAKAAS